MEMADFDVGVCLRAEKFVNDQDLDKAIIKVLQMSDSFENLSTEQRDGVVNFIRSDDVLAVLPMRFGKSLLFQLIPGLCVELHNLGYSQTVIWPLNAQIECYMRELKHHEISCTCLSGNDGVHTFYSYL